MLLSDFDFDLPEHLIAQAPLEHRDASRMLVLDRDVQQWKDCRFVDLPSMLNKGDVLAVNNTRVFPARLVGRRIPSGGKAEIFLVRPIGPMQWEALVKPGRRLKEGAQVGFDDADLIATIGGMADEGRRVVYFETGGNFDAVINQVGQVPLPPYIKRDAGPTQADRDRYQTIFAHQRGAIAAPTAGLHFTEAIKAAIQEKGIDIAQVTLHVGYGTFKPVQVDDITNHRVDPEYVVIDEAQASIINRASEQGHRVIAVGTTTTRALEWFADERGLVQPGEGHADLTILPGYAFKAIDGLITNFHLPQSSLLLLVAALAGKDFVLDAYHHAVSASYRFYSYGDCMFIH